MENMNVYEGFFCRRFVLDCYCNQREFEEVLLIFHINSVCDAGDMLNLIVSGMIYSIHYVLWTNFMPFLIFSCFLSFIFKIDYGKWISVPLVSMFMCICFFSKSAQPRLDFILSFYVNLFVLKKSPSKHIY